MIRETILRPLLKAMNCVMACSGGDVVRIDAVGAASEVFPNPTTCNSAQIPLTWTVYCWFLHGVCVEGVAGGGEGTK